MKLSEKRKAGLEKLVNKHDIMLFMKGSPKYPECGFSKQLVDILKKYKADFKYFDILEDDKVREGLKVYSDWPTYPQLYVKGELVGGLDVVKQMEKTGELEGTLFPKSADPPAPTPSPAQEEG